MSVRSIPRTAALLLALGAPLAAQSAPATRPDPARIEHGLRASVRIAGEADPAFDLLDRMRHYHVAGVSIAVVDDFRVVYARGFGVEQHGGAAPVDTTTLFLAGSISKPVFATGALALVEQGKLSLDDDVNRYLTSWKVPDSRFTAVEKVTLRRLLSHSAGLTVWGFPGYEADAPLPTVPQILDGTPPANTPAVRNDTVPGVRWLYSGGGFTVAQLMATDVTGESFPELMDRLVLRPLGMAHSTYAQPLPAELRSRAASGHEIPDVPVRGRWHVYPEMAAAGLWTTPSDLARWASALSRSYLGRTDGPITPATARLMLTRQAEVAPPYGVPGESFWGLGVALRGAADSLVFSHGGRDEGFVAQLFMWPERGRGLVIMTNGVSDDLMTEIVRAFDEEYGLSDAARVEKQLAPLDPASLGGLVGRYRAFVGRTPLEQEVMRRGDELWIATPYNRMERRLYPQGPDRFFDLETASDWTFRRGKDGFATALVRDAGGQQELVAERLPEH